MNSEQQIYTRAFIFSQILQRGQGGDSHIDSSRTNRMEKKKKKKKNGIFLII